MSVGNLYILVEFLLTLCAEKLSQMDMYVEDTDVQILCWTLVL